MSDSEPRRARHALVEEPVETGESEAPTTAMPSGAALFAEHPASAPDSPSEEYTDDATCVLPVIPVQRVAAPATESTVPPYVPAQPSGPPPSGSSLLAGVTAVLLVAGVAVGVGGVADPTREAGSSATP